MPAGSRSWLEITLDTDGDSVSVAGRAARSEARTAWHALGPGFTIASLRKLQVEIGAAIHERRPLAPSLLEKAQALHRALFQDELGELLQRKRAALHGEPLLVALGFRTPLLRAFPWEIACEPGNPLGFLGADPSLSVCRAEPFPGAPEPREIEGAPRVLACAPLPSEDLRALDQAMAVSTVDWLPPLVGPRQTPGLLLQELEASSAHVLHFVGRFDLDPRGRPALAFSAGMGEGDLVPVEDLARKLQELFGGPLRLLVLQAAPGTRPEAVAGAAALFARTGAGAVVAHLFPLCPVIAANAAFTLYQSLAERGDVAASLQELRGRMVREESTAEPFAPLVYLPRAHGGAIDALVLTATKDEHDALLEVQTGAWPGSAWERRPGPMGFEVALRTFEAKDGRPLRVVASRAAEMGQVAATSIGGQLIARYNPRCVAMSGVCAGRRGEIELGDVIFADRLWTYDVGKRRAELVEGERIERVQGDLTTYQLKPAWKQQAENFTLARAEVLPWLAARPIAYEAQENWLIERVAAGDDPQRHPDRHAWCPDYREVVERLWEKRLLEEGKLLLTQAGRERAERLRILHPDGLPPPRPFRVHVGPIASGNMVVEDANVFHELSASMRKVLGLEMEASAVGALARDHELPWMIVVKGVMDFADGEKDDHFKHFAARASAECLLAFLRENLPSLEAPAEPAGPDLGPDPRIFVFRPGDATQGPASRLRLASRWRAVDPALEALFAGHFSLLLGECGHPEQTGREVLHRQLEEELGEIDARPKLALSLSALAQRYALHAGHDRLRKVCERVLKELLHARTDESPPFLEGLAPQLRPGVHTTLSWLPLLERSLARAEVHWHRSLYAIQLAAPGSNEKAMILHRPPGQTTWKDSLRPPRPDLEKDIVVLRLSGGLSPEEEPILSCPLVTEDDHIEGLLQPEAALTREWAAALLGWLRIPSRRFLLVGMSLLNWRHRMVLRWLRSGFAVARESVAWLAPGTDHTEPALWAAGKGLPGEQGVHVVRQAPETSGILLRVEGWS
ncbi:CHAT domain-containing protein [Polyangium aurulentum]|uniref:CHAT domain-containing protein n=1 Tax=Polyangium aurulentum TaxID=2567896 RepID=UPI0010AE63AD|nr:CHAT domain-containing protein [Polyangium aurulentum]UQA56951.1 CHAT domain-containing protein [Polyangium aurulentum]